MKVRRWFGLLLASALLATWQSAILHPLLHVRPDGSFVHLADGHGTHAPAGKKSSDALCDALAAVTACVAGSGGELGEAPQRSVSILISPVAAPRSAPAPAYRSQAPPAPL